MQDEDEEDEPELPLPVQAEADADVPDVPPPPPMPSMEDYQRRWQEKKAFHSRENNRGYSLRNLVPKPLTQSSPQSCHAKLARGTISPVLLATTHLQ